MAAPSRKKNAVSILIPFLVIVLFFTIMVWQKYRSSREVTAQQPQHQTEGNRSVTLFFASGGARLARESREIDPCDDERVCLKSVLDELLSGPVGDFEEAVPEGSVIISADIEGNLATVNFNGTFSEAMVPGSSSEMLAVYAVVNTVAVNFPQVRQVKITVAGNKATVLSHLDLSEPLLPDYALEQPVKAEPTKSPDTLPAVRRGN
jgi:hypothetical protein